MKLLNIAHRGFSSQFPENTILAFQKGMEAGADGFECDLRITSDGHIVVFHDDDFQRLCGKSGSVETSTLAEVQKLKVKGKESIPTLDQLLVQFHRTRINLELKPSSRPAEFVEAVLRVLTKVRPQGPILFSSFSPEICGILHLMDPERKMGELGVLVDTANLGRLPESLPLFRPNTWNVPKQILSQPWAERWAGIQIPPLYIWTLDEPDLWRRVQESSLKFAAIITNKPDALSRFLAPA